MGEELRGSAGRWEGQAYASQSAYHRAVDDSFVQRCPPEPADEVVDAGCGSGEFTVRLAGLVPDGRVVGVELDPSMLDTAREHARNNVMSPSIGRAGPLDMQHLVQDWPGH